MKHKYNVFIHCVKVGIPIQGLMHDLSKFSLTEFVPSVKFFAGDKSPTEFERRAYGASYAWMHHKGRNKHHFEYWSDINMKTKLYEPVPMPINYIAEMFCDRVAASKIYKGKDYTDSSALEYYNRGNARKKMHPDTADVLEKWLNMLAERGEKETFAYIKAALKQNKKKNENRN